MTETKKAVKKCPIRLKLLNNKNLLQWYSIKLSTTFPYIEIFIPLLMFSNILKLLSSPRYIISYGILVILAFGIWWSYTDIAIMFGNYGSIHTYYDITLSALMITGFPLFLLGIFYRGSRFGNHENLNKKTGIGFIGGVIGTIISGCSCCGLTLAAYFGFLPLMEFLPYDGLELKTVATLGLLYALWSIISELDTCKMKR